MNTQHRLIGSAAAALSVAAAMIAAPTTVNAQPPSWVPCPAIDTEPICEVVRHRHPTGSDGTAVTRRPASAGAAEQIEIPDYNCDEWRNPVIACPGLDDTTRASDVRQLSTDWVDLVDSGCRRVPWPDIAFCPY